MRQGQLRRKESASGCSSRIRGFDRGPGAFAGARDCSSRRIGHEKNAPFVASVCLPPNSGGRGPGTDGPLAAAAQDKSASVRPDLKRGQEIAGSICVACHGLDGNSAIPANPKLSGQDTVYLHKQLNDFAKPANDKSARVNSVMTGMVGSISEADRLHVAAFYASQPPIPGAARNRDTLELGQRIFRAGIPARGVPACSGCHSPNGSGIPAQYPRLAGSMPSTPRRS